MNSKFACLISFTILLSLTISRPLYGVNIFWDGGGDGHSFSDPNNWDLSFVPGSEDRAYIRDSSNVNCTSTHTVARIFVGDTRDDDAELNLLAGADITTINTCYIGVKGGDGTINIHDGAGWSKGSGISNGLAFGRGAGSIGTLNMYGGNMSDIGFVVLGVGSMAADGVGIWNMEGGTAEIIDLNICNAEHGYDHNSVGHLQLNGGTIETYLFRMASLQGKASMDIKTGTLIINSYQLGRINTYIKNGWITAYGVGYGDFDDRYHLVVETFRKDKRLCTRITAVPEPMTLLLIAFGAVIMKVKRKL